MLPPTLAQEREFRGSIDRVAWRNLAVGWRVLGGLDTTVVRRVLAVMVDRHEQLRSCLADLHGEVVQLVASELVPQLDVVDLAHTRGRARGRALRHSTIESLRRPFDLSAPPLWRATLFRLAAREHILLLVVSHTIWDAYSSVAFAREFSRLYAAKRDDRRAGLDPLPAQVGDVAAWEQTTRDRGAEAFWTRDLRAGPRPLPLAIDRQRAAARDYRGEDMPLVPVPRWVGRALQAVAEAEGTTLAVTLLAAFALLLRGSATQRQIVIGVDEANRDRAETRDLIGYLLNVLPIRVQVSDGAAFRELVSTLKRTVAQAYAHRLPLRRLAVIAGRDALLYEATLNVRPYDGRLLTPPRPVGAPIAMHPWEPPAAWANFPVASVWWNAHIDLSIDVAASGEIAGELSYNTAAIARTLARGLADEFPSLLRRLARYPDRPIVGPRP